MNRHALRVLEFQHVQTAVRMRCLTEEGEAEIRTSRIITDRAELEALHRLVGAIQRGLSGLVRRPSLAFTPIAGSLRRVEKEGTVLEAAEIGAIAQYCISAGELQGYLSESLLKAEVPRGPAHDLLEQIPTVEDIAKHLFGYVEPDGTIREKEIPQLRTIRAKILRSQQELQRVAQQLIGRDEYRRYWNASVPTQREGRTVLPLKSDHRGKLKGIVHETSGSGATVFIEPEELVGRNNEVVQAENEYRTELLKILRELSAYCRERVERLSECLKSVVAVDVVYARALYGYDHRCTQASIGTAGLKLVGARHPLLGDSAVPINLTIPEDKRVLIITGPNTGGKTVSLKTVGLLALMNQFGLHLPADPGTELPLFRGIFADIGDEQSIEQNLSTFSGHMRNMARILNHADRDSLVLLDEVGSGTDPEEGGALAMSILDELLERSPFTVVTTHHGRLKHYGFTQDSAANASVEFDPRNLRPTYHIIPGVPGSSHAIEIAAQMGLLRKVTRRAKEYLSGEEYDTGRIIRRLTDREQEIHQEKDRVRQLEGQVTQQRDALADRSDELDKREADLKDARLRELERWSAAARSRLENLVRELREGELNREKTQKVKEFIKDIDDELSDHRQSNVRPAKEAIVEGPLDLVPGAKVRIRSSGKPGVLQRKGKGDSWVVLVGTLKLPVDRSDLEPIREASEPVSVTVQASGITARPTLELDLRGLRLEEALDELERQLDQAVLSGMKRFGVIHGMGEGVLQKGVRDALRHSSVVKQYDFAVPEDGGYGKTVVELE